jgi:serine/threonine protein kinase/WD40 repeat protein
MAGTVDADTIAPPARDTVPPTLSISVFDPPDKRFAETAELGRGGMGRVVEAIDRALGRSVAIKQSLASTPADLARFEREVRITAQLQHPSVIPILDVGRDDDGRPFYIMRKIEGDPLADRVDAAATLRDRLALVSPLLGAIDAAAYAHAKRIIHRDIKPWNILLGPFGETLLIDWGIARQLDEETEDIATLATADTGTALTRLGVAQGSPGFLAPEQARGEVVDTRADVYSLGATLFFVLAGTPPYGRIGADEAIERAAAGEPAELARVPEGVPRELIAITNKAMATAASERYADAGELAADLRRFLAGQLVAAHEYTTRERIVRWLRRHRVAATVTTVALIVIAAVSTIAIRQVIRDRDTAEHASSVAIHRADENLLDRARSLGTSDPTSAIAVLRTLRPESPLWPEAHAIARAAVRGGIERRIGVHARHVSALAFSPDGKRLASGSDHIAIHELPGGKPRTISTTGTELLVWWGSRTVASITGGERKLVRIIDVETGSSHDLDAADPVQLVAHHDRLLVREKTGAVVAYARDRTRTVLVDSGALAIAARGSTIVVGHSTAITVIDREGTRTTPIAQPTGAHMVLSPDASRVAILGRGVVHEWKLADLAAEPRQWPRSTTTLNNLDYDGNTLIAWAADGSGFVSLGDTVVPLWTAEERRPGVLPRHIVPFDGGALFVTDRGALAIRTLQGTTPLAHRPVDTTRIDIERSGRFVAYGLGDGSVLLLDLGFALPLSIPVSRTTALAGFNGEKTLLTGFRSDDERGLPVDGLSIFDHQSRELIATKHVVVASTQVSIHKDIIITSRISNHEVWDSSGKRLFELPRAPQVDIEDGVLYWIDLDGRVWSRTTRPVAPAIELGRLPAGVRAIGGPGTGTGPMVMGLRIYDGQPTVSLLAAEGYRSIRITPTGTQDIPTPPGFHTLAGRIDGVWWTRLRDANDRSLWRDGTRIPVRHHVDRIRFLEDRVWAIGEAMLTEIDAGGQIIRELALPSVNQVTVEKDRVLAADAGGVVEIVPATNVRSLLRAFGKVDTVFGSADGKRIVAMTVARDGSQALAYWTDPVPSNPAALRVFLDTLTNAHLAPGSDVLRWD